MTAAGGQLQPAEQLFAHFVVGNSTRFVGFPVLARTELEGRLTGIGVPWTDEEVEALGRLVRLGKLDAKTLLSVFPYRTNASVRAKLRCLQKNDPDNKWTPPKPDRGVNWDFIEVLEAECEESPSSETCTPEANSPYSPPPGPADVDL